MSFLRIVGQTERGAAVYAGVYRMHETTGVPLEVLVEAIDGAGGVVSVLDFMAEAAAAGMSRDRAKRKLGEAIEEIHGSWFWAKIERRLS